MFLKKITDEAYVKKNTRTGLDNFKRKLMKRGNSPTLHLLRSTF